MATIHWLIRIFRIFPVENGHTLWNFDTLLLKITIDSWFTCQNTQKNDFRWLFGAFCMFTKG